MTRETKSSEDWQAEFGSLTKQIHDAHFVGDRGLRDRLQARRDKISQHIHPDNPDDLTARGPGQATRGFGGGVL